MDEKKQTVTPVGGHQPTRAPGEQLPEARVFLFHKTALLIDGAWFSRALGAMLRERWPSAEEIYKNATSILQPDEYLYRLFFYESKPCSRLIKNPITGRETNLKTEPSFSARNRFFAELVAFPYVALRRGESKFRGWSLTDEYLDEIMNGQKQARPITAADIHMEFTQKGVDMRIGIDVASLAIKRLVDRIVIFTGDADLVPAMKLARTEGLQVGTVKVGTWNPQDPLIEDSDFVRNLTPKTFP